MCNQVYNLLKVTNSTLGYRHSEASKILISLFYKNRKISHITRDIKRKILLPWWGKCLNKMHVNNMRLGNLLRKPLKTTHIYTGEIKEFISLTEAGKLLGISRITVTKYLSQNVIYNDYKFNTYELIENSEKIYNVIKKTTFIIN